MSEHVKIFSQLANELSKLPNVGSKTAEKIAYYLLEMPQDQCDALLSLIQNVRKNMHFCSVCGSMTDEDPCRICTSPIRKKDILCVVKDARDISALGRMEEFDGLDHSLGGLISPIDGVRASDLRIKELVERVRTGQFREVILALSPSAEGETTAIYVTKQLKPFPVKITRIAHGIPVGGELEYADSLTLSSAMRNRQEV